MAKEIIDGKKIESTLKLRYPQINFDKLKMYFGFPYLIDVESAEGNITINIPTMRLFVEIGEKKFLQTLNIFTTNTTEYRLPLWESGVDWNEISDFDLFCMLYKQIDNEVSESLFGDINFSDFELFKKNEQVVLYNPKLNIEINEEVYQHIAQYLRVIFKINPAEKLTKDRNLKELFIQKDKSEIYNKQKSKNKNNTDSIQPLISACVNHPGFKYKLNEVLDLSVYTFYDSVSRLNIYENTTAVLKGMYSGMIDGSHFKSDDFNFMKDI